LIEETIRCCQLQLRVPLRVHTSNNEVKIVLDTGSLKLYKHFFFTVLFVTIDLQ
jgi:hypothetical protein